uniref:hAT-like transposase RNase-H fold domain-containing protein n=1 Tax=Solanum lycopersicum TaxID=4081 RepID=A0A3Q7GSP9_SOLLC
MGLDKNKSEETEGNFSEAIDVEGEKRGENEGGLLSDPLNVWLPFLGSSSSPLADLPLPLAALPLPFRQQQPPPTAVRWNFTYLMLDTVEKFEKAFERFDLYDSNFNSFLATDVCEDESIAGSIQYEDWANVSNVIKFFEKFYELTLKVSSSRYVTCNIHFEDICELDAYLKLCMDSDDLDLSKMASELIEEFKNYCGTPEKMNKIIFIVFVLDPRNKFVYVNFSLEELLGEEMGNVVNTKVKAYLRDLFAIYLARDVLAIPMSRVASGCAFSTVIVFKIPLEVH